MLTEARDAPTGERFYALGHEYVKTPLGDFAERLWRSEAARSGHEAPDQRAGTVIGLRQGWDAAFPPSSPPNVEFVAGYIGGGTPHVWTDAEWAASLSKSTAQLRLPIFVRVPPTTRDPVVEANFCADYGERHDQPKGTLIALDYETSTVQSYLDAFDDQIVKRGYKTVVYGSRSTVMQLRAPSGGRWSATWNNVPHMDDGAVITQYGGDVTLGQPYDLNVALDSVPFWGGTVSASGPQNWDANDWASFDNHVGDDVVTNLRLATTGNADVGARSGYFLPLLTAAKAAAAGVGTLQAEEDQTQAAIALLASGGLDPQVIANAVIAGVGPEVAQQVADLLAIRIAS